MDAQSHQLEDVGAGADAAVRQNDGRVEHLRRVAVDLVGHLERRGGELELAPAVVGDVDPVDLVLDGVDGVADGEPGHAGAELEDGAAERVPEDGGVDGEVEVVVLGELSVERVERDRLDLRKALA